MFRGIKVVSIFGMILCLAMGCGGGGPTKASGPKDGRVFVRNESVLRIKVTLKEGEKITETMVEPDETKEVSEDVIKGGTKITVIMDVQTQLPLVAFVQDDPRTLDIVVDGRVTIRATAASFRGNQWRADYEILGGG